MHPPGADTVILRVGDVSVKSPTVRRYMMGLLREHVEALLERRELPGEVEYEGRWGRPVIHATESSVDEVAETAASAFGVVSTSPVRTVDPDLETICDALAETAIETYDGGSFAVDARRAGTSLPFTSEDVEREGGATIWDAIEAVGGTPTVDLDDPDYTVGVEVRSSEAYVYLDADDGPGGLPLGSQRPMVALLSGGIDSPVAAYEAMRRGSPVIPVYVDLGTYGGVDHEARAVEAARTLETYAPTRLDALYRVPGGPVVETLIETMEEGRMLSLRRFFFRAAEVIADREDAAGIVTGESQGQKSSQTAANMAVTSRVTDLPIHRPLLTLDKQDIVARAREIGTFTDSTIDVGCNRVAPGRPETNARLEPLLAAEPADLLDSAEGAASEASLVEL